MQIREHILFITFLLGFFSADAQFLGPKDSINGRKWNIRFTIDGAAIPIDLKLSDAYQGEYYARKFDLDGNEYYEWEWKQWDSSTVLNPTDNLQRHFRLGIEVNVWKGLYAGVNYSGFFIKQFSSRPHGFSVGIIPFGTLEGQLGYSITFKNSPRFTIQPSIFGGTYASDYYEGYEGIGKERALGGKLALGFVISKKRGHMFRIWGGRQDLWYKESERSFVYEEKIREYKSHWTFVNMGFGLMWNISFREDP